MRLLEDLRSYLVQFIQFGDEEINLNEVNSAIRTRMTANVFGLETLQFALNHLQYVKATTEVTANPGCRRVQLGNQMLYKCTSHSGTHFRDPF